MSGVCAPLHPCAGKQTLVAVSTTWMQTRAAGRRHHRKVGNLAITVLQLEATPAARRRYMALAG